MSRPIYSPEPARRICSRRASRRIIPRRRAGRGTVCSTRRAPSRRWGGRCRRGRMRSIGSWPHPFEPLSRRERGNSVRPSFPLSRRERGTGGEDWKRVMPRCPMTRRLTLALAATLVSVFAAACSDNGVAPLAMGPTTPPLSGFTAAVTCEVTVSTATLACGRATPVATNGLVHKTSGIEPDVVTLGGQGSYVLLTSSGTHYDGSSLFTSNVTLTNLLALPMNTADGTTADTGGVKVFFNSGPSVTGGTGTVTVANPDGTGTFTGTGQPFFKYSGGAVLGAGAVTASKTWRFNVPPTVTVFAFTVYVTSELPVTTGRAVAKVTAREYYACGVTTAGAAYCWGYNGDGELGNGTTTTSPTPVAVSGGLTWAAVSAGLYHTCGVTTAGAAYCWGYNGDGELGDGTTTASTTPVAVTGGLTFATVSPGEYADCGGTTA